MTATDTYQKSKLLRNLFNRAPAWALGIADEKACANLLAALLVGAKGRDDDPEMITCAVSLARWGLQFYPLAPELLSLASLLEESGADMGPGAALLKNLNTRGPGLSKTWQQGLAALLAGDEAPLQDFWATLAAQPALTARLQAEAAILACSGPLSDKELALLAQVDEVLFGDWKTWQLARAEALSNDRAAAIRRLAGLRAKYPWQTNLTQVLHQLVFPLPALPADAPSTAILLYSWNKCAALRTTLESLRASELGGSPVFVLNNGSSDDTAAMLGTVRETWGTPFTVIDLPANVGAPAARNWLLTLPEVRAHAYAAFLDDDVILPGHWLSTLRQTAAAHPNAGSIGCLVTDHIPPYAIQAADFHLLSPDEGLRSFSDLDEHIFPFCPALGQTDPFAFRYTRPCVSVTGCCHLLSMRAVEEAGAFDVRFNPSQFDDLERDLRLNSKGWPVYYTGLFSVRHMQHSSLRQALTVQQQAHIMGNRIKLEFLYSGKEAANLQKQNREQIENDLLRKSAALDKIQAELLERQT